MTEMSSPYRIAGLVWVFVGVFNGFASDRPKLSPEFFAIVAVFWLLFDTRRRK